MKKDKKIIYIALISTVVAYFILANFYKTYRSEVDILIVPQNEKTAVMHKQVLKNAAKIPLTVSFFDRLTEDNIDINNSVDGFSASAKKIYWNKKLETKIIKNSGIIKFIAKDADSVQAESIADASATNDIIALSAYYNIKEDVQMRIIDGPITVTRTGYASFGIIIVSLIIGVVIFVVFTWLIPFIQNRVNSLNENFYTRALSKNTVAIKKDAALEPEKEEMEENFYAIPEKELIPIEKKAFAPENLPTASTTIESMFGATKNGTGYKMPEKKMEVENPPAGGEKPAVYREATPEEVKERLNRLLGGM